MKRLLTPAALILIPTQLCPKSHRALFSVPSVPLWLINFSAKTNHRDTEAQRNQCVTDF